MKKIIFLVLSFVLLTCSTVFGQGAAQLPKGDRYLVVVSMDGFRWD